MKRTATLCALVAALATPALADEAEATGRMNRTASRPTATQQQRPVLDFSSDTYQRLRRDPQYSFVPDTFLAYPNWQMLTVDRAKANEFLMRAQSGTLVIFSNYQFLQKIRERRMATDWPGINELMEIYDSMNDTRGLHGQISLFTIGNRPYAAITYRLDRDNVAVGIVSLTRRQKEHYDDFLRQRR